MAKIPNKYIYKKTPDYPAGSPGQTVNCKCVIYGIDDETTEMLNEIAREIDRMTMEPLKSIDPGNMIQYFESLPGHFKIVN